MSGKHQNSSGSRASKLLIASAALAALAGAGRHSHAQLVQNSVNNLSASTTSGTITILKLNLNATANNVDLTLVPASSVLTFSAENINKIGVFNSSINGGTINSSDGKLVLDVDNSGGLLTINSTLADSSGLPLQVIKNNVGTLVLNGVNNATGGLFLNAGRVQFSNDINLGALNGKIVFGGGVLQTSSLVTLNSARTITVNGGGAGFNVLNGGQLTLAGNNQLISGNGAGGFTKGGGGTFVISGPNTFNGPVTVAAGVLELQNTLALGSNSALPSSPITLLTDPSPSVAPQLNLHSAAFDATGSAFFNSTITVAGLTGTDSSTIDVAPPQGVNGGNAQVAGLVLSNATLNVTGLKGSLQFVNTALITGPSTINNAVPVLFSGEITGNGSLIKTGVGTLTLSGDVPNTYTDPTIVAGGTLALAKPGGAIAVPGNLTIQSGSVVFLTSNQIAATSTISLSNGSFNLNGQQQTVDSFHNDGADVSTGAGTLIVTSINTTSLTAGSTTINTGGTLNAVHLTVSGGVNTVQAGGTIVVGAGGLDFQGTSSPSIILNSDVTLPGQIVLGGDVSFTGASGTAAIPNAGVIPTAGTIDLGGIQRTFTINDGTAATDMKIGATIVNGSIRKSGAGTISLSTANTYAGGTTLVSGTLQATDPGALGSGSVTFSGGTLDLRSDAAVTTFSNALASNSTASTTIVIDRLTPGATGTLTVPSITLGAALNVSGSNGGTLAVSGPLTLQANATINNAVGVSVAGVVGGGFGLTKTLGGTLTFSGASANTYGGATSVDGGTLQLSKTANIVAVPGSLTIDPNATVSLGASEQIADTAPLVFNATGGPAVFNLNDKTETVGSLTDLNRGGTINLGTSGAGQFAFGGLNDTQSFNGTINGSGSITKFGSGAYSFGGVNTFTGGASVRAGSLTFTQPPPGLSGTALTTGSWSVFGGATLAFPGGSTVVTNQATILLTGVNPTFTGLAPLASNSGSFSLANGAHFTTAAGLVNDGTVALTGAGTVLTVIGGVSNTGTPASTGTTSIGTSSTFTANFIRQNSLTVNGALTIRPKASGGSTSVTNALSIAGGLGAWTGKIDLADNSLTLNYSPSPSPAATILDQVKSGYSGNTWTGNGFYSTLAAADPTHYALGWADGADGIAAGVTSGQVLVKYARAGDANLDGIVNVVDLGLLATHYGHSGPWDYGDFNYSGTVDVVDLGILATNYGHGTSLAASEASLQFQHDVQEFFPNGAVPEPSSVALMLVASFGLLARRRVTPN